MHLTSMEKQLETYKKRVKLLEQALAKSAGFYYNINITKDIIQGAVYQVVDGIEYNINDKIGFTENCSFREMVAYLGKRQSKEYAEGTFDIILMDIMMPNMNGYEATEAIRNTVGRTDGKRFRLLP